MIRKIFKKLGLARGSKSSGSTSRWRLEVERQNSDRHSSSSGIGTGVIKLFQQIKDNIGEDKILTLGYKHLLSLACEHLNFDAAAAFVIDHDDNFGLKGYVNLDIDLQEKYFITNSGMMTDLFNKDIPKFITDIDLLPANCRGLFKDFKAVWLIPLLPQGMAAGVLVFGHKEIPQHREDYYPKLDFVTIAAGWFFENHHKERLIDRENKKNLMLVNTSLAISSSLDLDEVCHVLVSNLGRSFGCSYSYVMLSKDGRLDMFVQTSFSERGGTVFLPGERFINIGSMAWLNDLITMGSPVLLEASDIELLPKRDKEILKINGSVKVLVAPLKHASKLTGLLLMVEQRSAERTRLDNEVVDLCAALVAQAAAAIENARLYSLISDRVAQITTMFEVGQALNTDLDLIPFFERVLKAISNNFRIMTCSFFLKDFDTDELYLASVVGQFPGEVFGRRLKIGKEGITGHAAATGHIINVGDVKKDSRFVESTGKTASELAVPVILNGSVVGVLDIESEQNYAFTQREEDLLKSLVDQVAVAIEKIKLKQLEKERSNKLALTNSMLKKLSGVQDQAQLLSEAVKGLTEGFGFDLAAIFIPEGNGAIKLAQQSCRWGEGFEPGLKLLPNEGLPGKVSIQKASCHLNQINPAELNVGLKGIKSRYCLPLLAGNTLHGVLDIQDRRTQAFSPIDISTIQTFAEFLSIALNNIQLYRETIDKAERLSLVDQINQAISITLNLEELFGKIVQSLSEITGYQWAALVFKKGPGYYVRSSYLRGNRSIGGEFIVPGLDSMDKHFNDIYAGGPPQYCNINEIQISKDLYDFYHQQGINYIAVCPIKQKGLIQGILIVGSPNPDGFSYQDRILLHDVSMHLEIALNNAILYGEIKEAYDRLHEAQEKLIQSEKFKALGEVAAGIAHDFKNILAAIMGRAQLLSIKIQESESLPIELVAKGLEVIDKAATDGVNILSRITEFSKNKNKNNFVQITLNEVLDDSIEMIRPKWEDPQKQKEIKISTNYFEPLPIWGDRSEMVEVFSNLIINAVDAIKKTGEISISGYGEGENAVIKISDTGVGIDHETIKRIFDPFFSTKGRQGTGLGLTMVYAIIERHGGEISVESTIGQGTTFTIRLPQYSSEQESQKFGIVVVGDNQSLQNELRQFLNKSGFRAFSGQRIDEILKIIRLNKIDMVAIDAGLALEDLREMIKRIREHSSALPIVLMVEDEAMLSEDHYAGFGTIATVKKPLDAGQILQMLNKFEDGKSNVSYFA